MKENEFCYWLQGYFELTDSKELDSTQVDIIKDHLKLVFNKVTPNRYVEYPTCCNGNTTAAPKNWSNVVLNDTVEYSLTPGATC